MTASARSGAAYWLHLRSLRGNADLHRLLAMMGLFFLVVCAVGILRPIKNALALDGLGATDFYKVYLVSAAVVLFVPVFNRLADRFTMRTLFSLIALFFAANLLLFRLLYREGSAGFGLMFYGWYDLFAAALVTQFFMATQVYFDARSARQAYPIVIAGGSLGATLGGGITGFFAESVGTPNLLLVAALLIGVFAAGIPWVLASSDASGRRGTAPVDAGRRQATAPVDGDGRGTPAPAGAGARLAETSAGARRAATSAGAGRHRAASSGGSGSAAGADRASFRDLFADRHVVLIAGSVLLTIVVKQLVDYQFNVITKEVFVSRDAISAFQGKFNAATQWLPLVVLAGLRPALRRWGVGAAVLMLPVLMLLSTAALALTFGLWAAVAAKGAETSLRYSAERTGREILYVPLRDSLKMKAKAYIDVAVEKGVGKVVSALFIMVLLQFMHYRHVAWVSAGLAVAWVALSLAVRREYVRSLARSIQGRFASLHGTFATLLDATTLPVVRRGLTEKAPVRVAFTLELLAQAPDEEIGAFAAELTDLLAHEHAEIRASALAQLARVPDRLDPVQARALLHDDAAAVRETAVRALLAAAGPAAPALLNELLLHQAPHVRTAALHCTVGSGPVAAFRSAGRRYLEAQRGTDADADTRVELALAAGRLLEGDDADNYLAPFLEDADPRVRSTALRSAALLGRVDCCDRMIAALGDPRTRVAARDALALIGEPAIAPLEAALMSTATPPAIRRVVPSILARIPAQQTVDVLLACVLAPETDQLLDYRTIKALSKLRARHPDLVFDPDTVLRVAQRECAAAVLYSGVRGAMATHAALPATGGDSGDGFPVGVEALLHAALADAFQERREGVFRCLGMILDPDAVRRTYIATSTRGAHHSANALEWLEQSVGHVRFERLAAALEPGRRPPPPAHFSCLANDGDSWIALLARVSSNPRDHGMQLIEKVFLLQQVDLLRGARGAHIALLASIADEVTIDADTVLLSAGVPPDAMYVVTEGSVALERSGERLVVEAEGAFGTWALIDEHPSVLEARTLETTRLLRVTREDFHDLLADHSELAVGLLQGLALRVRSLVA